MPTNRYFIRFHELSLWLYLGCLPGEQDAKQEVRVSAEIELLKKPEATLTDSISDTLSYSDLIDSFQTHCEQMRFDTIERLAEEIYSRLAHVIGVNHFRSLKVLKVKPPLIGLLGGAEFEMRNELKA
jgi:FolB domain-containing protein